MRLKTSLGAIPLFIIIILFIVSIPKVSGESLDAKYANTQCGISIQYPSSWKSGEDNDDSTTVTNFIVEIQPGTVDGFRSPVYIELNDISGLSNSFVGIKDFEEQRLTTEGGLSRIIASERTQVSGYPAQKIVYTEEGTPDSSGFKRMKVLLVAFDREYVITYDASNSDYYDDYISAFEDMLKTFQISEPKFDGINC
jgi:hypothetical protein